MSLVSEQMIERVDDAVAMSRVTDSHSLSPSPPPPPLPLPRTMSSMQEPFFSAASHC
eukprot:SAG11_NODE_27499_length_332_cov_0.652361_1_plen_56_part_10